MDILKSDSTITPELLKAYQVIVWNNNTNGAASVPTPSARQAILDYVNQGGGWLLVGLALMHDGSWADLDKMVGARVISLGSTDTATMQVDSAALVHPELRFVVNSIPARIDLKDVWVDFNESVRSLENVTVLYTAIGGQSRIFTSDPEDRTYVWARNIQKGKLLACPPGWYLGSLDQSDSAVAKLYWNSMRWLAGDFQNGCTDPNSSRFNPDARVDDGSCNGIVSIQPPLGKAHSKKAIRTPKSRLSSSGHVLVFDKVTRDARGRLVSPPTMPRSIP